MNSLVAQIEETDNPILKFVQEDTVSKVCGIEIHVQRKNTAGELTLPIFKMNYKAPISCVLLKCDRMFINKYICINFKQKYQGNSTQKEQFSEQMLDHLYIYMQKNMSLNHYHTLYTKINTNELEVQKLHLNI